MSAKAQVNVLNQWFPKASSPLVIAGPCSAESEKQVLEIATQLAKNPKVAAFRAGVWKPRTRPGSFEGIGEVALNWLNKAKAETGLPIAVEVANAHHVEAALRAGVDIMWIGARTTVNPFFVQEIAEALAGTQQKVLVKNPIHPELGLWLGALERLDKAGLENLAAVHRGFFSTQSSPFRNEPKWELSFELRAEAPHVPILADPSHIAGNRNLIQEVSQTALDLNLDGLMIETHNDPDKALSDAAQQITPQTLFEILNNIELKKEEIHNDQASKLISDIREKIDHLDRAILDKIATRNDLVREIAKVKFNEKITIFQLNRWFQILEDRTQWGAQQNIEQEFIQELFQVIHKHSVGLQTAMNKEK